MELTFLSSFESMFWVQHKTQNSKHKIFEFKPKLKTQKLNNFEFLFYSESVFINFI